jgi:predicted membrane-bound spermidine synthase
MSQTPSSRLLPGILFLGGAAALAWQLIWSHQLGIALGASARGVALTVATAMAGMTLGSLGCGRLLRGRTPRDPVLLYGLIELAIGLLALIPGVLSDWIMNADARVHLESPALATPFMILALLLTIGPATLMMGATLPVMGLLARSGGRPLSRLYSFNTAGAATGTLVAAFFLMPKAGLGGTSQVLFFTHLFLALFCLALFVKSRGATTSANYSPEENEAAIGNTPFRKSPGAGWLAFLSGAAAFMLEVAWFRTLKSAWFSTADSLAVMLFCFLIALALGAALAPWWMTRRWSLAISFIAAAFLVVTVTPWIERFDSVDLFQSAGVLRQLSRALIGLLVIGPPVVFIGISLPTLLDEARGPRDWARLYAVNTLGAVVGANLAAWVLLPAIGPSATATVAAAFLVIAAMRQIAWWRNRATLACLFAAFFGMVQLLARRDPHEVMGASRSIGRSVETLALRHGPDASISVVGFEGGKALLINGFFTTAEVSDPRSHYLDAIGRIPMLLHPDPQQALVICFGTGQTAHAVRDEDPLSLDLADLNAAVFDMAGHFDANRGVLNDPRVSQHVMDGRAWLRRTATRYEVVTLEPMPPFFSGSNSLYSREFYELVHDRLAPGGILAQWFPLHLMSPDQAKSIAATFRAVFPDAILWFDPDSISSNGRWDQGILIGRREPGDGSTVSPLGHEWPGLRREALSGARPLSAETIRRQLTLDPEGLARFTAGARVITDDNQLLEYGVSPFRSKRRIAEMIEETHSLIEATRPPASSR